jgi:AAA ATPase-like protein
VSDPKPHVATKISPVDGLNHRSAITFEIAVVRSGGEVQPVVRLPEDNNGLGYQNLISMIFRLMAFRDAWMRVGKASRGGDAVEFEPLHLVLVEEPEAHLHAQVQQVFIKKAYDVLRAHIDLGDRRRRMRHIPQQRRIRVKPNAEGSSRQHALWSCRARNRLFLPSIFSAFASRHELRSRADFNCGQSY